MRRKFRKSEEEEYNSPNNGNTPVHEENVPKKGLTREEIFELKKRSKKVRLEPGTTVPGAVEILLSAKEKGENIFIVFNGIIVFSCEINNKDDGFKKLTGKTELERRKGIEEDQRKRQLAEKEEKLRTLEKMPLRIEEGKKYIDEAKWKDWENKVNDCVSNEMDLVLDNTLEILKMIDLGESWENIQETFKNQGHAGWSYNYVKSCVVYFSRKGKEADIYL